MAGPGGRGGTRSERRGPARPVGATAERAHVSERGRAALPPFPCPELAQNGAEMAPAAPGRLTWPERPRARGSAMLGAAPGAMEALRRGPELRGGEVRRCLVLGLRPRAFLKACCAPRSPARPRPTASPPASLLRGERGKAPCRPRGCGLPGVRGYDRPVGSR